MLIFLWTAAALARPDFPGLIQEELDSTCAPECVLCHEGPFGGMGTATRPFGVAVRDHGVYVPEFGDTDPVDVEDLLITALRAIGEEGLDQDGDGISDIEEIKVGEDPNLVGNSLCPPEYGCFFSHAPVPGGLLGLGIAAAAVLASRKRRTVS